jgi:metallo-beta-lactamase family protein
LPVRVRFLGGVQTVTGSMHLFTNGSKKFIIDCGLFQGRREEAYDRNLHFPFDPAELDACVLSHAHIDHSGNIPNLVKHGFRGRVLATEATRDLCAEMLPDSGHIQEEDIRYVNKMHKKQNLPPREPIYTRRDAEESIRYIAGEPYHAAIEIADGASVTFYEAGHVLGSALPLIEFQKKRSVLRIAYIVDLGRAHPAIIKSPERPPDVDYMILESTYGGRVHSPIENAKEVLARTVRETAARGGKLIIPSFALERTQEVVYYLSQLLDAKRIPRLPVYVDSPLAVNINEIFIRHPECFDERMLEEIRNNGDPLGQRIMSYVTSPEDSEKLDDDPRAMIIVSASGMCESGRILHHLRHAVENPRNTVLIVGFVAKNTLGRRIVEREPFVRIFGEEYPLRAQVVVINAFSAHADRNELLDYVAPYKGSVKEIFIVHGDEDQSAKLLSALRDGGFNARIPAHKEECELG